MAVKAPTFLRAHATGVDCIFTMVLPCETFAESSDDQLLLAYPTPLRYHRAICLGKRDDRIRRISQASNVKKPHVSLSCLESSEVTKGTKVPFNPTAFSAIERLSLPHSARICLKISEHLLQSYASLPVFYRL